MDERFHTMTEKSLRALCWIWIVAGTMAVLFCAPVSATYRHRAVVSGGQDTLVTETHWIGPFGSPFAGTYQITLVKSSIDFSRLITVLLVVNFIPAVVLWQQSRKSD